MDEYLKFATQLAVDARVIALKYFKTNPGLEIKDDKSPVTIADTEINTLVVDRVKSQYPNHGILGEEQSWHEERSSLWVCDPIDGTIAFTMGEPSFMFSIALVEDGEAMVAATSNLANGDLFSAMKGGGAYLNGKPIHVSSRKLEEAWLAFPTNLTWLYDHQKMYQALAASTYQTNIIHGGVFKNMLVAQGLADAAIWPESSDPWDMAASQLIVTEAGGKFTNARGERHRLDEELTGGIVASNNILHQDLLNIIQASENHKLHADV